MTNRPNTSRKCASAWSWALVVIRPQGAKLSTIPENIDVPTV